MISLWLPWIFTAVCRLSLGATSEGLLSNCGAWASHCRGFSCCGARALGCVDSVVVWLTGLAASRQVESSRKRDETCVPCSGRRIPITGPPGKFRIFHFLDQKLCRDSSYKIEPKFPIGGGWGRGRHYCIFSNGPEISLVPFLFNFQNKHLK